MKASQEQIQQWKGKYGEIFRITVEDKECYLKKPNRKTIGYATVAAKDNPLKFGEVILRDCFIGGDEEFKTDDTLFLSANGKLAELIEIKEAELEKL